MQVALRPRAVADLISIRDYLLEHAGDRAAESVRIHLAQRIRSLGRRPSLGIASSHPAIRILCPTKYPYRIYFAATEDAVVILHIRHTARRLPKLEEL